jgi:hypothetical protein
MALLLALLACAAAAPARRRRGLGAFGSAKKPETCGVLDDSFFQAAAKDWDAGAKWVGEGETAKVYKMNRKDNKGSIIIKKFKSAEGNAKQPALGELLAGVATCAPGVAPCHPGTPVVTYEG